VTLASFDAFATMRVAIANRLGLSEGTVRNYLSEAIGKIGATNRVEAARIARAAGCNPFLLRDEGQRVPTREHFRARERGRVAPARGARRSNVLAVVARCKAT
jgi:hypothetical protein